MNFFRLHDMALNKTVHCYKIKRFFFRRKALKIGRSPSQNSPAQFREQGIDEQLCEVRALSSNLSWDHFVRRNEQFVSLRNSQVPEHFCAENIATEQLWWNFWPTWQVINFCHTVSPVHSFEIEFHKESKKLYLSKYKFGPTFMHGRLRPQAIIFGIFPWI